MVPARFNVGVDRYRPSDADELADFQCRTFGAGSRQVDPGRAAWLFDRNPSRSGDGRDLWVCRRDGAIVGQQAEIPFDLCIGTHERRATWAIDLMVDAAWRRRGIGPALVATQLERRTIVGALNLSDKGYATYRRGGWTDLGIVPVYLRPLDLPRAASLATVAPPLRRVVPVAGPVLRTIDGLAGGGLRLAGVRLEPIDRFDDRVDEIWQTSRTDYPVLARRDLAALAWRLDQRPDRDTMQRFYLTGRRRTLGYVVLRRGGTAAAPTAVVVDYLAPARWVAPLLVAAGVAAGRQDAVAVSIKSRNEAADRYLRAAGFLRRDQGSDAPIRFMVHCTEDDDVCALVRDRRCWFVTSADSDLEQALTPRSQGAASRPTAAAPDPKSSGRSPR